MKADNFKVIFSAKTIKDGRWVDGYYFKTPLTDEDSGTDSESGWHFLSDGKIRHCIANENGAVFVIDEKTLQIRVILPIYQA